MLGIYEFDEMRDIKIKLLFLKISSIYTRRENYSQTRWIGSDIFDDLSYVERRRPAEHW